MKVLLFLLVSCLALVACDDLSTVTSRRLLNSYYLTSSASNSSISNWIKSQTPSGNWSDVVFLSGCDGRRASWQASGHWSRVSAIAAAWSSVSTYSVWKNNSAALNAALAGMDWWFSNDYNNTDCVDKGGLTNGTCPCGTPGFWNTNWYCQVILIPKNAYPACLLLRDQLSASQLAGCDRLFSRSYTRIGTDVNGLGQITGANLLDVSSIGVAWGVLSQNSSLLSDAFNHVSGEFVYRDAPFTDGIKSDGSFQQHLGLLYTGNYGKDFINLAIGLQNEAAGTAYQATPAGRDVFTSLITGSEWFLHGPTLFWDFAVTGRFISGPVSDKIATGGININLTALSTVSAQWSASQNQQITQTVSRLLSNNSINPGGLNDVTVHRRNNFVITFQGFSNRTINTECLNTQNNYGYHLADGAIWNHITAPANSTVPTGQQYTDIFNSWDWTRVPGTTTLATGESAGIAPITCAAVNAGLTNKQSFVGGVSDGNYGVSVQIFTDPFDARLTWRKAVFFFEDSYLVSVSQATLNTSLSTGIVTTLDQRRHGGQIVFGQNNTSVWHDGIGYFVHNGQLSASSSVSSGNWSTIGISAKGATTNDIFLATISHRASASYSVYPAQNLSSFQSLTATHTVLVDTAAATVAYDSAIQILYLVAWQPGTVNFTSPDGNAASVQASSAVTAIFHLSNGTAYLSDPSQTLAGTNVNVNVKFGGSSYTVNSVLPQSVGVTASATLSPASTTGTNGGTNAGTGANTGSTPSVSSTTTQNTPASTAASIYIAYALTCLTLFVASL
ncbi:polysaccharide lyase family 8 protein [Planoprotostelium fungivorum]|uniref:Polysaccharide lyase family 8 protein n=1 Tax=Planoprotostelium fungivorum TaxID=1890364 RepID=A0A2P6NWB3_9EUKA|nr:polysaccharide lyase family 8 protein [Planoprotostelium fungivorum]